MANQDESRRNEADDRRVWPPMRHARWHEPPPWQSWDHGPPHWSGITGRQRGKFFLRFFGMFATLVVLVLGGMGIFAFLLSRLFEGGGRLTGLVWVMGCSLSMALPLLAGAIARNIFQGVTTPIADVMTAAEAVAEGDFSVQVPVPTRGSREFQRLAVSFNRMTARLNQLDQQRRNLTADVAHELRTPLHIIQGNLEGILDGVYEPTPEQVHVLLDEVGLLTRLVEDLQLLSTVESGHLTLKMEMVDIQELLADVGTSFSGQLEAAGVDLQIDVPENPEGLQIQADPERLDQVISNIVANALRYTPKDGKITMSARPSEDHVQILVADTGEGIAPQDLPYIFDRFWKGDRSRSRAAGEGSGLGLAISRNLVQAHGGTIQAESEVGVGTTFIITLPRI
ncbi:MAG: sensor histidine kinase [Anaerolineales bacterium]